MPYYADTSAIAKLYVSEAGSERMLALDLTGLAVSALVLAEMASALARRRRDGSLPESDGRTIWERFRGDLAGWVVVDLAGSIVDRAAALLYDGSLGALRTLDALQLVSALEVQESARGSGLGPVTLLTADERLATAATTLGLPVENPAHPS